MKWSKKHFSTTSFCLLIIIQYTFAQAPAFNKLVAQIDTFGTSRTPEKLYLQLDKPYYSVNDTIWFKAYLLNADLLNPSTKSSILYFELVNDSSKIIKRLRLPVLSGKSWGQVPLDQSLTPGNYTLRAYTNWQRNYNENYEFKKGIYIIGDGQRQWLINQSIAVKSLSDGSQHIDLDITLKQGSHQPVISQPLQIKIRRGKKLWYSAKVQTGVDGAAITGFDIPANTGKGTWVMELSGKDDKNQTHNSLIPITIDNDIDLQFMPESGKLVAGLPAHIGFKALNSNGYGVDINGIIRNNKHEKIIDFKSVFKGIGSINFTPVAGEIYTATITYPDGSEKIFQLPDVQVSGVVMTVRQQSQLTDTLRLIINATSNILTSRATYLLIGHSHGKTCFTSPITFDGKSISGKIPTAAFPQGVANLTLFTDLGQPICERAIFIDHHQLLKLALETDKREYHPRDSVALRIKVTDENNKPVSGNFSMAVTDDGLIKRPDSDNIISHLLITDELKGEVEQQGYYFNKKGVAHLPELDNLLLTQGWTGFDWNEIFKHAPLLYEAEPDLAIKGKATSGLNNKGKPNEKITLFRKIPFLYRDTLTDANGRFMFSNLPLSDSGSHYVVKAENKKGSTFNMRIALDEWEPPIFKVAEQPAMPWYVNIDTAFSRYTLQQQQQYLKTEKTSGTLLKTVTVNAKKAIKDSHNLNGAGGADMVITEEELLQTPKKTLLDLLYEKIPGFNVGLSPQEAGNLAGSLKRGGLQTYLIKNQEVKFVFDGTNLDFYYNPQESSVDAYYHFVRGIFNQFLAADVKGVELMQSYKNAYSYNIEFGGITKYGTPKYTFIEITTRDGKGPFINQTPGIAVDRSLLFTLPKAFYRPRYGINKSKQPADWRSTIHWEPNILTDNNGEAMVSFYTADHPGSYSLMIEGTDMQGRLGVQTGQIKISKEIK